MELRFSKWHGTGNDFILVDDRTGVFPSGDRDLIRHLCDRHFGIGSDGLILIQAAREEDLQYHMEFFNPDASQSFCGNGSRCAFSFWRQLMGDDPFRFEGSYRQAGFTAIDGRHSAEVRGSQGEVGIAMRPPASIERYAENIDLIHTGSPHLLVKVDDPDSVDIVPEAHRYRYSERFRAEGVNVNFIRWNGSEQRIDMRTYERGVEAETLSCGTGVTAAALAVIHAGSSVDRAVEVRTRGGRLRVEVHYDQVGAMPTAVTLIGPSTEVFHGFITI